MADESAPPDDARPVDAGPKAEPAQPPNAALAPVTGLPDDARPADAAPQADAAQPPDTTSAPVTGSADTSATATEPVPEAGPPPAPKKTPEEKKAAKQEKKAVKQAKREHKQEEKRRREAYRPIDSWERYRALNDAVKLSQDLVDLGDHKVRFALIIGGALNGGLALIGARTSMLEIVPRGLHLYVGLYIAMYLLVALNFFIQAVETLRPRRAGGGNTRVPTERSEDKPLGLRFYEDVLQKEEPGYHDAWRQVRVDQLNAELSHQAYNLARINKSKYTALGRLYIGLRVMTVMAAGMLIMLVYFAFAGGFRDQVIASRHKGRKGFLATQVLGQPTRFTDVGVKDPTGVTYHAALNHLFVSGDDGEIAEMDTSGHLLRKDRVKGTLADLAVHTPSGKLLITAEKRSELILWDPVEHKEMKRWALDRAELLGEEPTADKNHAFAGLSFRSQAGLPGGGVFYLTHQREPQMVVGVAFDPLTAPDGLLHPQVVSRWGLEERNLLASWYEASIDRLLVLSAKKGIIVLSHDGTLESEIILPGDQDEGLCIDPEGTLWVADALGKSLLRFPGALQALKGRLALDEETPASPASSPGTP